MPYLFFFFCFLFDSITQERTNASSSDRPMNLNALTPPNRATINIVQSAIPKFIMNRFMRGFLLAG